MNLRKLFSATMCAALISAFASSVFAVDKKDCYKQLQKIEADKFDSEQLGVTTPLIYDSYDSIIPIVRAYEKEGLLYEDIAIWFDKVRPEAKIALKTRFAQELSGDKPKNLLRWLRNYSVSYRMKGNPMSPKKWAALTPQQQLDYILSQDDIFSVINVRGRSEMFYTDLLYLKEGKRELAGFDFLLPSEITPDKLGVGNDLGSYEVKTSGGIVNQTEYLQSRKNTEDGLEGKVGHQHLVHGWPSNEKERIRIAPYYIETLDASTWAIFWYQAKRNPTYVESIVGHPYLGVYTRDSLNRLYKAMLNNDVSRFKNKFRMIGSRVMKADASIEGQNDQGDLIPDWEIRAGNKSMVRDDTESLLQARLMSGDYDGLLDYRSYKFDPSDSDEEIFKEFLSEEKIAEIKKFEENFPMMEHSDHALAHNHFRNKIIAPVLP